MPVCVECGVEVSSLYREYSRGSLRLAACHNCSNYVDKYVEYDNVHIVLDLGLQRIEAHRHLIYNRIPYLETNHFRFMFFFGLFVAIFGGYVEYRYVVAPGSQISVSEFIFWAARSILGSSYSPALLCCVASVFRAIVFTSCMSAVSYYLHRLGLMEDPKSPRDLSISSANAPSKGTLIKSLTLAQYSRLGYLSLIIWPSFNVSVAVISTLFSVVACTLSVRAAIGKKGEEVLEAIFGGTLDSRILVFCLILSIHVICRLLSNLLIVNASTGWSSCLFY